MLAVISDVTVVFETWGELDAERSNAILVEHALTRRLARGRPLGSGPSDPGWWDALIGSGRALDTDRYFVVCPNVLGGCQGTTGPSSLDEAGVPYGSRFPAITIRDQVAIEVALSDHSASALVVRRHRGSMGGMRALELVHWLPRPGAAARSSWPSAPRRRPSQIALCSLQNRAIAPTGPLAVVTTTHRANAERRTGHRARHRSPQLSHVPGV